MIPANFKYHRAQSVQEAIDLLKDHGDQAKLLAGGHSLIPALKLRLDQPGILINIGRLPELDYIKEENGEINIGAATTHDTIANSKLLQSKIAMFSEAADMIGDVQVRNMGTIGGSIAHADPAADWPAVLIASGATIVVKGFNGERSIEAGDFFTGFFSTALEDGDIITHIRVPIPSGDTKTSYKKFMQPASRFAIVGCAAMITQSNGTIEKASVAFTGVSDGAFQDTSIENALNGQAANADTVSSAAEKAASEVDILGDHFASEEYRQHLAKVYAKRTLMACIQ